MFGRGGLFRQENMEKRRVMSVREWAELCADEDLRAPGKDDIGLQARSKNGSVKTKRRSRRFARGSETAEPDEVKVKVEEHEEQEGFGVNVDAIHELNGLSKPPSPPLSVAPLTPVSGDDHPETRSDDAEPSPSIRPSCAPSTRQGSLGAKDEDVEMKPNSRKRRPKTQEEKEAQLAERARLDEAFLENFDPHSDWLPDNTTGYDYTPDFCRELERRYWRNCGLSKPAWYGADMQGS